MSQLKALEHLARARDRLHDHWNQARWNWQGITAQHFEDHGWTRWEEEAQDYQQALEELQEALGVLRGL